MPDPGTDFLFSCSENGCGRVFASSRGLASHRGRQNQQRIATMAQHADVMTRPLGGRP